MIGATWDEIDLKTKVWTVPAGRIKGGKEHRVPLSEQALEILRLLPTEKDNPFVFIGSSQGTGLSNMAMAAVLKRMGRTDITVHGFRSTSAIGPPNEPTIRIMSLKWRSPTSSAIRSRPHTGVAIFLISGDG